MSVKEILVGVDGSGNSSAALAWAVQLANLVGARVTAVHALGLLERIDPDVAPMPSQPYREAIFHRFESEWCAPLAQADVRGRCRLGDGPPAAVLMRMADEEDADLIVIGRRGGDAVPGLTLGSTSLQLAHEATRPVVVIP